jgi:hypothetical protein
MYDHYHFAALCLILDKESIAELAQGAQITGVPTKIPKITARIVFFILDLCAVDNSVIIHRTRLLVCCFKTTFSQKKSPRRVCLGLFHDALREP